MVGAALMIYIVTDLGYGDSGKGTTVDFLARQGNSLVVRHNGGPQAGHNVVLPDGHHHEFSQFGSGHFAGASTFLSKHMLINPADMLYEAEHLGNPWRSLSIDMEAKIITPFHVALNRVKSYARGESCGRGIGELMRQDIDRPDLTIRVKDLMFTNLAFVKLEGRLQALREYLGLDAPDGPESVAFRGDWDAESLIGMYHNWRAMGWYAVDGGWLGEQGKNYDHLIFEGAQGVLLDESHGFHPYTTWSTTTHDNALSLLNEIDYFEPGHDVTRLGVTRAYMTRHGAGPFVTEDPSLSYSEPHNTTGTYQGAFRQGHLDLGALKYAIEACGGIDGLVVTHLDRSDVWRYCDSYRIKVHHDHDLERQGRQTNNLFNIRPWYSQSSHTNTEGLLGTLADIAPIHIISHGPTHADKQWVRKEVLV